MTLQDIEIAADIFLCDRDAEREFEKGLTDLMPFVRVFARSLSRNKELAEDLAQGTLMKAWQSRKSFTPGTNLKAWLCVILRNDFYSHKRRAWRQMPWDPAMSESLASPSHEQDWTVELADTACAMSDLPRSQRDALLLVGVGGFTSIEAAALSNCAVGTVKSRVGRARNSLKENLNIRNAPPDRRRSAHGGPIDELLSQLRQLTAIDASQTASMRAFQ